MNKELAQNLVEYFSKKGMNDIKVCEHYIDVFYTNVGIRLPIRIYFYNTHVRFSSPESSLIYPNVTYSKPYYNSRGTYVSGKTIRKDITRLKVSLTRTNFNGFVYKKILDIIEWVLPVTLKLRKEIDNKKQYASELEFYFNDKYGNVSLNVSDGLPSEVKNISASVKIDNVNEQQHMVYVDGEYSLMRINRRYVNNEIYSE